MMMNIPFVRLAWLDFLIFPIIHSTIVYSTYIQNILYCTSHSWAQLPLIR